jgi:cyclophilin family peptidyl-prolyl cis-trans isomerase
LPDAGLPSPFPQRTHHEEALRRPRARLPGLIAAAGNPLVELKTSAGPIVLELYPEKAPKTVANFLEYVKAGFYDGLIFHRVIDGFMIQGGGMNARMEEKPPGPHRERSPQRPQERRRHHRHGPHPGPALGHRPVLHQPRKQPRPQLPVAGRRGYAVFGKVSEGMDVVRKIGKEPTTTRGFHQNVPATPVIIQSARQLPEKAGK